jgi:crotonobetainyl-CoA:carnitine CoA-transferase CaiB-like acyl-CoA transferase
VSSALKAIKVLDLSRLLPGPFASLVLADLGAQVDKIEDSGPGDYLRHMPPLVNGESVAFLALNRNKRSCVLDLKKPAAREAFLALAGAYDVLLEQFRPGVLDRLGLSHAVLRAHNPRLIVCALTGYGQDGPLAQRAGHDLNYLARAGVLGFQGPESGAPQVPGFQLADVGGGLWCVVGILAALAERARTGQGKVIDVAMLEASIGFAAFEVASALGGGTAARGADTLTGGIAPYSTYLTKDGQVMALGALEPKFWGAFCEGVGLPFEMSALVPGPHQAALKAQIAEIFRAKTRAEWEAFARERDCCLEPVLAPAELARDPHLSARGVLFEMDSPWGKIPQFRTPLTPKVAAHRPPPRRGEHTAEILREAGVDASVIAELAQD